MGYHTEQAFQENHIVLYLQNNQKKKKTQQKKCLENKDQTY